MSCKDLWAQGKQTISSIRSIRLSTAMKDTIATNGMTACSWNLTLSLSLTSLIDGVPSSVPCVRARPSGGVCSWAIDVAYVAHDIIPLSIGIATKPRRAPCSILTRPLAATTRTKRLRVAALSRVSRLRAIILRVRRRIGSRVVRVRRLCIMLFLVVGDVLIDVVAGGFVASNSALGAKDVEITGATLRISLFLDAPSVAISLFQQRVQDISGFSVGLTAHRDWLPCKIRHKSESIDGGAKQDREVKPKG